MNKLNLFTKAAAIFDRHAPAIFSATAITGTLIVGVTAYKAGVKSKDKSFKESWTNYIPPVIAAGVSIGSVICLNRAHNKHYAALLATYAVTQADNERFKDKIRDILGKDKVEKAELDVQREKIRDYSSDPYMPEDIIDKVTGVKLNTSKVAILQAANMVNAQISERCAEVHLTDFYDCLGVSPDEIPEVAERIVFNTEHPMRIEFGGLTGRNFKTFATFYYDYNYTGGQVRLPWD